nr:MAG TPA: hypothetical protein [Caudoviricetes sp.]
MNKNLIAKGDMTWKHSRARTTNMWYLQAIRM